ncbi:sugar transporter SWEET1 [Phlebotomus argentipes]|uniref:sugar transporter SWEET1 n=1 Tax=Phlebotomus argentipes TaxID=94469 RepID=UPI0028936515|nr:sugar transporter SWEET1 [Phlebotomus argentipes]
MEVISNLLQPYKGIVSAAAGIATTAQFFSGAFVCNDIRKAGSAEKFPFLPFIGGTVFGVLGLQYGVILRDDTMIPVNLAGLALSIIYVCFFYNYTPNHLKGRVWAQMGIAGAFSAAVVAYAQWEDENLVETRFGLILTAVMVYMISAPLFDLGTIIRNQSVEGLPFPIIFSGTVVSFLWLLHGFIILNTIVVVQNLFFFTLSAIQLSLFAIYPSKPTDKAKKAQ